MDLSTLRSGLPSTGATRHLFGACPCLDVSCQGPHHRELCHGGLTSRRVEPSHLWTEEERAEGLTTRAQLFCSVIIKDSRTNKHHARIRITSIVRPCVLCCLHCSLFPLWVHENENTQTQNDSTWPPTYTAYTMHLPPLPWCRPRGLGLCCLQVGRSFEPLRTSLRRSRVSPVAMSGGCNRLALAWAMSF